MFWQILLVPLFDAQRKTIRYTLAECVTLGPSDRFARNRRPFFLHVAWHNALAVRDEITGRPDFRFMLKAARIHTDCPSAGRWLEIYGMLRDQPLVLR